MPMLEEIRDPLLQPLAPPRRPLGRRRGGAAALPDRLLAGQLLTYLGHSPQDRPGQLFDDMEFTDLVGDVAEDVAQRLGVQGRAVGGDPWSARPRSRRAIRKRGKNARMSW